jgi:hypothetical protein
MEEKLQQLRSVKDAINGLLADPKSSQSVSSANGGSYSASFIDLDSLRKMERELTAEIAAMARGGSLSLTWPIYGG